MILLSASANILNHLMRAEIQDGNHAFTTNVRDATVQVDTHLDFAPTGSLVLVLSAQQGSAELNLTRSSLPGARFLSHSLRLDFLLSSSGKNPGD